jgi:hypothetical protein
MTVYPVCGTRQARNREAESRALTTIAWDDYAPRKLHFDRPFSQSLSARARSRVFGMLPFLVATHVAGYYNVHYLGL